MKKSLGRRGVNKIGDEKKKKSLEKKNTGEGGKKNFV